MAKNHVKNNFVKPIIRGIVAILKAYNENKTDTKNK